MKRKLAALLLCAIMLLTACTPAGMPGDNTAQDSTKNTAGDKDILAVHFIDVGQADCILITSGEQAMLVDAGNGEDGELIVNYLDSVGVEKLDYVIGTHPHEDHIGSLDTVIDTYDIGTVIMPRVQHNTKTFEDVLDSIAAKDLKITAPRAGTRYELGSSHFTVLGPTSDHGEELNDWSVGIKLVYGETSFVMCGDAETEGEADIIATGIDLRADVLKLGHHGSSTSTSDDFLRAVSPEAVVICCGVDNSYGHPHRETMEKTAGLEVYRTDEMGTIVAESDGVSITWSTAPQVTPESETAAEEYVLNTNSKKFHYPDCSGVEDIKSENRQDTVKTREELISAGYDPCGRCKP